MLKKSSNPSGVLTFRRGTTRDGARGVGTVFSPAFLVLSVLGLVLVFGAGCASLRSAHEKHRLSDARQIVSARYMMMAQHPEQRIPSLSDIVADHALLDAERVAPFEITAAWNDPEADEEIVLRQVEPSGGRSVVAQANGRAFVLEDDAAPAR